MRSGRGGFGKRRVWLFRRSAAEDPNMREDHYMDKLIDELARGKKMEKTLRAPD